LPRPNLAQAIGRKAMEVASDLCVYTNKEFIFETLTIKKPVEEEAALATAAKAPASPA
jgi:hypothetical protein